MCVCDLSHISDHPEHPHGNVIQKLPPDPCPTPPCPHWAWLACNPPPLTSHPQTPPRGPETDASALRPSSSQTDKREREKLPWPPPPSGHVPAPRSAFTSVAVCGTDSFSMDSLKNHAGWRTCVPHYSLGTCLREGVRLSAASDSCWQCAISVCFSVCPCCVRTMFFQINVKHLGSSWFSFCFCRLVVFIGVRSCTHTVSYWNSGRALSKRQELYI